MGALTNIQYAYLARPWEIRILSRIAISSIFFPLIQIQARGRNILRILPSIHQDEWITDDTRFFLSVPRIESPLLGKKTKTQFVLENWVFYDEELYHSKITIMIAIMSLIEDIYEKGDIAIILGSTCDVKIISILRTLANLNEFINIRLNFATARKFYTPSINNLMSYLDMPLISNVDLEEEDEYIAPIVSLFDIKQYAFLESKLIHCKNVITLSAFQKEFLHLVEGKCFMTESPTILCEMNLSDIEQFAHINLNQNQLNQDLSLDNTSDSEPVNLKNVLFLNTQVQTNVPGNTYLFTSRLGGDFDILIAIDESIDEKIYFDIFNIQQTIKPYLLEPKKVSLFATLS